MVGMGYLGGVEGLIQKGTFYLIYSNFYREIK
jgi:hypothetical protein